MPFNMEMLKIQLRLMALSAIPEIERQAAQWFKDHGVKMIGPEKWQLAIDYVAGKYAFVTQNVPGLNATDVDDNMIKEMVKDALQWAWDIIGEAVNEVVKDPVVDDTTLPQMTENDT